LADALDEPVLTDIGSGAELLLSTALPDGLSDPFNPSQDGWIVGSPGAGTDESQNPTNPFVGQDVDPYTNLIADGINPNAYIGDQNVDPFSGIATSGVAGPGLGDTSQMLASNAPMSPGDPADPPPSAGPPNPASALTSEKGQMFVSNDLLGPENRIGEATINGVQYAQYQVNIAGVIYNVYANDMMWQDKSWAVPVAAAPTQATQPPPLPSANPSPTPPPTASPPPAPPPTTAPPAPGPQTGSGTVPFDPLADSPVARWLLAGSGDTPIRDFFTNDSHLKIAQYGALGVAGIAATIATGGAILEAAPGLFGGGAGIASSTTAATVAPLATGAAGVVAADPQLPDEVEEAVANTLPTFADEIEETVPSIAEQAATKFQDIVRQAERFLRANPDLIMDLGGSSKGAPISPNQLGAAIGQYAQGNPAFARALSGNALEAIVNAIIEDLPPGAGSFMQVSGPNRIDFIGTGAFEGYTFELTTEAGVAGHAARIYLQEAGAMIFTYQSIIE
jgi:hypothetical protein